MLGTDDWLESVMFYDNRGRVVQTQGENHLGGTDITVTQYDFTGRVLNTHTTHENPQASANSSTEILKTYEYDRTGRLLYVKQKIGSTGSVKTLVANTYNELGELESKALGTDPQNTSNPLETLDYDYNVRGWLKSVNGDYVANGTGSHYFGMDLSYDFGFESNRLNGNIAGVKWRTRSSPKMRAYGFDYDPVNRLLKADYHQKDATVETSWSKTLSDFSTSYGYDANGNILNLTRKGVVAGTITTIDQLTYDYGAGLNLAGASNQLIAVYDPQGDLGQGDFKDGNVGSDDYSYDANGNMKDDMNKGISNITYNHLNLPVTVSFGSTKSITYVYDAAGIKLAKVVDDNGSITTTDYAAGFIYENDELQHFAYEEGRVRKNNAGNLVYDYFIKDHLGNTRMTLTEHQETTIYRATMEVGTNTSGEVVDAFEESVFLYVDQVRDNSEEDANTTNEPGIDDEYSARLNGTEAGKEVGPAKMIVVNPGDQLSVSVDYYHGGSYSDSGEESKANMITAIAGLFGGVSGGSLQETAVYNQFNAPLASAEAYVGTRGDDDHPRAYLTVVVFDKDFNLMDTGSAFKQVELNANNTSLPGIGTLSHSITLTEGGYVYVYLSNESQTDFDVHFDNLEITHTNGTILQEDHYYPFGANISALSSTAPLNKPNLFKYNGKEVQTEFDLNWYDYGARNYDAQLGKWFNIDPLAEKYTSISPFAYVANNPIRLIDPNGEEIWLNYSQRNEDGSIAKDEDGNAIRTSVEYRSDGKLYTVDGEEYVGSGDAESEFFEGIALGINYLRANDVGYIKGTDINVIHELLESPIRFKIGNSKTIEDVFYFADEVKIHQNSAGLVRNKGKWGRMTPALKLLHELGHMYNDEFDPEYFNRVSTRAIPYDNEEEKYVIEKIETPAALKLGQGTRNNHGGKTYESTGPTSIISKMEIALAKSILKRLGWM